MRWFKHDSDAIVDPKLKRVRLKYGMEGYGLYWYCLECIARNVEKHNLTFELEEDAELIASDTGIHYERVQEMMVYMVELGLFENADGLVTCMKMAKRTDEYTAKLLRTNSGHCPDKVPPKRREEKRIEEKDKPTRFRADVFLKEYCNNKQLISDWLKVRKEKKAANTKTAMERFIKQVEKSNLTCEQVLEVCCERSWAGFNPEWMNEGRPHLQAVNDHRKLL